MLLEGLQDLVWIELQVVHHLTEGVPLDLGEGETEVLVGQQRMVPSAGILERAIDHALGRLGQLVLRDVEILHDNLQRIRHWREQDGGQSGAAPPSRPMPVNCLTPLRKEWIPRGQRRAGGTSRLGGTPSTHPEWTAGSYLAVPEQGADARFGRRMAAEKRHQTRAGEWLDDEQVGGRRVGVERNLFRDGVDFLQRFDQTVRVARDLRAASVRGILTRPGNRHLDEHCGQRRQNQGRQQRNRVVPAVPALVTAAIATENGGVLRHPGKHHDRGGQRRRDGAGEDVAILHVRKLVRKNAFELRIREDAQDAFGRRHGGVLGIPPGCERVGRRIGDHVHLRHWQHHLPGQTFDDVEEAMAGSDLLRAVHAQHDLVGPPVRDEVHHGGEEKGDDQTVRTAEHFANDQQQAAEQPEQEGGLHTIRHRMILAYRHRRARSVAGQSRQKASDQRRTPG